VLTVVLLATPLIGTVAAHDANCHHDRWQKFDVAGSFSFLDILQADHKYWPSTDNVRKLVMNWDENMITYDITVGGITYSLGQDFTYSGHAEFIFYDPVFENPQLGNLYPTGFSAEKIRIFYKYDFSVVPGGLEGAIHLAATLENDVLTIRSLWGTRDFRDIRLRATSTDTFDEATLTVNLLHDGWVSGWPCVISASMESASITYDDLTAMCLATGLQANPYPAPTVPVMTGPDENMIVHITGASAYYTFTQKIGRKVYDGISCNVIDWSYNVVTLAGFRAGLA
jgi:hypothetical protein